MTKREGLSAEQYKELGRLLAQGMTFAEALKMVLQGKSK